MKKVTVVIPVYDEADVIAACLRSLSEQRYEDFEIIVVDDGSSDKTWQVLSKLKVESVKLKVFKQEHKGPGAARNLGAKYASGDILVFVDADMTFDKDFITNLVKPINQGKSKGTFSKEEYVSNWENVWARCFNINQGWGDKVRHPANYPDEQKVFRAILKSEFIKVGGFKPGGYTDDYSLSDKLGYLATAAKSAKFFHTNPESLWETFNQARWSGKRRYKLGKVGYLAALLRASFPVSFVLGLYKSLKFKTPAFLLYKCLYDFGVIIGIFEYLFFDKAAK